MASFHAGHWTSNCMLDPVAFAPQKPPEALGGPFGSGAQLEISLLPSLGSLAPSLGDEQTGFEYSSN